MSLSPWIERLLGMLGIGLLAIYGAAHLDRYVASLAGVSMFQSATGETPPDDASPVSRPNFALWSPTRIEDYKKSLADLIGPPLGVLRIPSIDLEAPLFEGTDELSLNRGVGRITGTALLGDDGNMGIAGHRDGFFRGLKDVKVGDRVLLSTASSTEAYVIDHIVIVSPSDVSVLAPRERNSLTLVTCFPFYFVGSAPQRYIVQASIEDVSSKPDLGNSKLRPGRASDSVPRTHQSRVAHGKPSAANE